MELKEDMIKKYLEESYPKLKFLKKYPKWIQKCHWRPNYLLTSEDKKVFLAIDLILSGSIPMYQYTTIIPKLLEENPNLSLMIITFEDSIEDNPEIERFCIANNIGLKIVIPGIGLQTILGTKLDVCQTEELTLEEGWFPTVILEKAKGLKNLYFHNVIDAFIENVEAIGDDEQKTLDLVNKTVDKLLRYHPSFSDQHRQFMKLANFEAILRFDNPGSSEHAIHSFRVFLAGCPVINEFYNIFRKAQKPLCKVTKGKLKVEYIWLLTAVFHDTGRLKEAMEEYIHSHLDDEDFEVSINIRHERWTKEHNIAARRVLGSLGAFVVNESNDNEWDGGAIDDEDSRDLTAEWIKLYEERRHSVVSAFDFLGDIFKKATAAAQRGNRPFIITHATVAALSILLHDWKIWPRLRKIKQIPVNVPILPMAALLIYIDTWDNYKRQGPDPLTYIREYCIVSEGVCVKVERGDLSLMKKNEVGYKAYKSALKNLLFKLDIIYGMAGTI